MIAFGLCFIPLSMLQWVIYDTNYIFMFNSRTSDKPDCLKTLRLFHKCICFGLCVFWMPLQLNKYKYSKMMWIILENFSLNKFRAKICIWFTILIRLTLFDREIISNPRRNPSLLAFSDILCNFLRCRYSMQNISQVVNRVKDILINSA